MPRGTKARAGEAPRVVRVDSKFRWCLLHACASRELAISYRVPHTYILRKFRQDKLFVPRSLLTVSLAPVPPFQSQSLLLANTIRPNNIISSAVAVDLAGHPKLAGTRSLGTVTGIINGSGSIVAAMGEEFEFEIFIPCTSESRDRHKQQCRKLCEAVFV